MSIKNELTATDVMNAIAKTTYVKIPERGTLVCIVEMNNGTVVTGHTSSATRVSGSTLDDDGGAAWQMAFQKATELENYLLLQRHHERIALKTPGAGLNSLGLMRAVMAAQENKGQLITGTSNWAAHIGFAVQDAILASIQKCEDDKSGQTETTQPT